MDTLTHSKNLIEGSGIVNVSTLENGTYEYELGVCNEDTLDNEKCIRRQGNVMIQFDVPKNLRCNAYGTSGLGMNLKRIETINNVGSNNLLYAAHDGPTSSEISNGWTTPFTKVLCTLR
jgi:hypothetical protein